MKRPVRSNLGLKHYILLLTLLPSLLITTALTSYLIISRQADAREGLLRDVTNTINYLAKASELALFGGDKLALSSLAEATVISKDMKSVTFYDSNKKVIMIKGEIIGEYRIFTDTSYQEEQESQWVFQTPVNNSEIEVDDFPEVDDGKESVIRPSKFLGWVQITADKTRLKKKQQSILLAGATIGMLVFSLLAFLALRFAHSITLPLDKITKTVKKLESGDLTARVDAVAKGEMNELVHGINLLANGVEISNQQLQKNVDLATSKLTFALANLEQLNLKLKGNVLQEREQREEQEQMLLRQCRMANMGEMLDSIAHQWRQPLMHINSILMNMGHAIEDSEKNQEYLENKIDEVASLTTHMSQTIEDFRGLFKLEKEKTQFFLEDAINDVLALMKNVINNIEVDYKPEANLSIVGHRSELIQVIIIVLSNAVDALNKQEIKRKKINIKSLSSDNEVVITLEDNAGGIDQAILPTIFDPYFTTKEQTGGTGLGLYIAKIIIEQKMGGRITASNTDSGANFTIVL